MLVTLDEAQAYVKKIPINKYFQMQVLEIGEGYAKTMTPYNPELTNVSNNTHGGVFMIIADMTFFQALFTLNGFGSKLNFVTSEIKTNFLSSSKDSELYAEARIIKNGRRNIFGVVSITDATGKILTYSTVTCSRID